MGPAELSFALVCWPTNIDEKCQPFWQPMPQRQHIYFCSLSVLLWEGHWLTKFNTLYKTWLHSKNGSLKNSPHLCLVHLSHFVHSFLRTSENQGGPGMFVIYSTSEELGDFLALVCMHGRERGLWRRELDLLGDWKGWNKQPDRHICQAWIEQGLRCHSSPVEIVRDDSGWSVSTWLDHQTCWQTVRLRDVIVLQGNGGADLSPLESLQLCSRNVYSANAGIWALHASQTVILLSDQWQCVVRPESLECLSSCKKYNFFQRQNCDKQVSGQKHLELNHVSIQLSYSYASRA